MMTVWVMVGLVIVAIALLFFHFSGSREVFAAKISGMWINPDRSIKIVIYEVNSVFQAEIIWVKEGWDKMLGKSIVKDLQLDSPRSAVGTYLCPFTKRALQLKLKMFSSGVLKFHFTDSSQSIVHTEHWQQVKA